MSRNVDEHLPERCCGPEPSKTLHNETGTYKVEWTLEVPHYETRLPNGYNKVQKIQRQYNTFDQGDNGYGYKNKQKILITGTVQKESIWSLKTGVGTIVRRNSRIHPQEVETPNGVRKNGE